MTYRILAVNPGSTSTKIALFDDEHKVMAQNIAHPPQELSSFQNVWEQQAYRQRTLISFMSENDLSLADCDIIVARGGTTRPIPGGIYDITSEMLADMKSGRYGTHPTNVGCHIAFELGKRYRKPVICVDPPVTDEMSSVAKYTGIPEIRRQSSFHALNQKATARKLAADLGKSYSDINAIICHLGGGISVGAHLCGRVVDVNNALNGDGPFSPERAGSIPTASLVELCFSGEYEKGAILKKLTGQGGLTAHLGTADCLEIIKRIRSGDQIAAEVLDAMCYQIAKEVGAMAAALCGKIDGIGLTGSLAHAEYIVSKLKKHISFIAPVYLYRGENEMEAMAAGALRYLRKEEESKNYTG